MATQKLLALVRPFIQSPFVSSFLSSRISKVIGFVILCVGTATIAYDRGYASGTKDTINRIEQYQLEQAMQKKPKLQELV